MTAPIKPPRLALALLQRFVPDDEPLSGDLVEEFQLRRSRTWFWWQVLTAIVVSLRRGPREIRPLRLVDGMVAPDDRHLRVRQDWPAVNLTASPIHGVGGLGLVALAVLITVSAPGTWWIALGVVLSGIAIGLVRLAVVKRRRRLRD